MRATFRAGARVALIAKCHLRNETTEARNKWATKGAEECAGVPIVRRSSLSVEAGVNFEQFLIKRLTPLTRSGLTW